MSDMIKDLSEAIYYFTTAKAMEEKNWENKTNAATAMKETK